MGDYGGAWRGADTRRVPSPEPSARAETTEIMMTYLLLEEPMGLQEAPDALGGTTDIMGYGGGAMGTDLAITGGPGMGLTGVPGAGSLGTLGLGGLGEDPALLGPGGRIVGIDVGLGARQGNLGLNGVTQEPEVLHGGLDMLPPDASSTLFVDGLPLDCSRREAAHIFRPFIGFKEVRLVHKDAKRVVLCFVEFADARCAATALEALQGYKFDETDPDSYALRLSFARHPGPRGISSSLSSLFRNFVKMTDGQEHRAQVIFSWTILRQLSSV
ncbi:hypothetical protein R1flu_019913 [Riccia fluitans]|uniref:RRM domain-containing protein n=1 Tax=Riccia fluitans TaxID=41844 RepID=A0ABD1ZLF5_9MARC